MEYRAEYITHSPVKRWAAAVLGAGALLTCIVLADSASAGSGPIVASATTDEDNSGPGGGGGGDDSSTSTDNSTSSTDGSSTSAGDSSTSSTDDSSTSSSTPGTGAGSAPGTEVTFPEGSWEALALAPCAGQTGDPELAAALLEALDPTGATERDRGSRRLALLVERCAMTFVGDVVPELGRPVTWFEQIANDDVIVMQGDTTNDVTPNDAQLALLDAAAAAAFPTCTPQPASVTESTETGSSVSSPSTESTSPTSASDASTASSNVATTATQATAAASNRCASFRPPLRPPRPANRPPGRPS